jgi:CHAD domain-containing protein
MEAGINLSDGPKVSPAHMKATGPSVTAEFRPLAGGYRELVVTQIERERKFDAPGALRIPALPGTSVTHAGTVRLTATYWDTIHRRLLGWGHTLRHRRASDGSEDRWTLKLAIPSNRTEDMVRAEVHASGSALFPPASLRALARAVVRKGLLTPVAVVVTQRRQLAVVDQGSAARIELDDDRVWSVAGLRRGPAFHQIELEAASPNADRLMDEMSDALIEAGATPTDRTKMTAVLGKDEAEPEIVPPPSGPKLSIRDLVRTAIGSGASRLVANDPATRLGSDPEALHQARVATRRLRSDLKTLEPLLDPAEMRWMRGELAWVGELLGSVRDTDVLIEGIEELATEHGLEPTAVSAIVTELEEDRRGRHAKLVEGLGSRRYVQLVDALIDADVAPPLVDEGGSDRRARARLRKLVRKSWRRVARGVADLGAHPSDADLHEIRKRAKLARYAAELATEALHEEAGPLAERLADLQDVLGQLQDTVVAKERLTILVRQSRLTGEAAFAAGRLVCLEDEARSDALDRWPDAWKAARVKRLRNWLS